MKSEKMHVGAEITDHGVYFRIWAPGWKKAYLVLEGGPGFAGKPKKISLKPEGNGYFGCIVPNAGAGTLYRYTRGSLNGLYPDPASRFQPDGPFGPSEVIDPRYPWSDSTWEGAVMKGQIIYEIHIGTFTRKGDWQSAASELNALADLGISIVELMPLADFPGRFGWGYDGVNLFAPTHLYGRPEDFRMFVDRAHSMGIAVVLDVVYNHLGPEGCFLSKFSKFYFNETRKTEWGTSINFDGENSGPVRELFLENVRYWIREFHLDGLRVDATQSVFDDSSPHILAEISANVHKAAGKRKAVVIAENEPQNNKILRPHNRQGYGFNAMWNDDFHHSSMVALTGHNEAYYSDHLGKPQEFIAAIKWGFLYQGQWYSWQKQKRGTPSLDIEPECFINYIQNHDQVANSIFGRRVHFLSSPGKFRAITTLLLLAPQTPMLFQGQEFCSSSPFLYFADLNPDIMKLTWQGRSEFLKQFRNLANPKVQEILPEPSSPETFIASKLNPVERCKNHRAYELHRDLIKLRWEDPIFSSQSKKVDGAVLNGHSFLIRFFGEKDDDRLLLVNFGMDLKLSPSPEPLLAPPLKNRWELLWSSEDPKYGGSGTPDFNNADNISLTGHSAILLRPFMEE